MNGWFLDWNRTKTEESSAPKDICKSQQNKQFIEKVNTLKFEKNGNEKHEKRQIEVVTSCDYGRDEYKK